MSMPIPVILDEIRSICSNHERLHDFALPDDCEAPAATLFIYLLKLRNLEHDLNVVHNISKSKMLDLSYRRERMSKLSTVVDDQLLILRNHKKHMETANV